MSGRLDSNQRPLEPHSISTPSQPPTLSADTPAPSDACTNACTDSQKTTNETKLDALAAALSTLTPEERAKLAIILQNTGGADASVLG
jgi:hypothetical protein